MRYPAEQLPILAVGTELGNYRLVAPLDMDAGLSRSYLAEHRLFARKVVISHTALATVTAHSFARWLSFMERLRHPQIIGLLDCGDHAGFPYAVMQYVEGRTLHDIVGGGGPIDLLTALRLFSVVASTLAYCHRLQIAHGDLKHHHVVVSSEGLPFLKGFEAARGLREPLSRRTGFLFTPGWCAPEVWRYQRQLGPDGADIELEEDASFAACDVWAFGLSMYVALTGDDRIPRGVHEAFDKTKPVVTSPEPMDLSALIECAPAPVVRLVEQCVSEDPKRRYRDGTELEYAIDALIDHVKSERSPTARVQPEVGRSLLVFAEPLVSTMPGHYLELQVTERLGGGAFAEVFRTERAWAEGDSAPLALKVLRSELVEDAETVERFRREAIFLSRLSHPNVVKVHAFGKLGVTFFILEEFLEGVSLRQWLLTISARTLGRAVSIMCQLAAGLSAIHDAGLIHRDLKPANIVLVGALERAVITDFGIAHSGDGSRFTQTGAFLGTPAYAAPEQLLGKVPSVQTDLYALGMILFELLTGLLPHGQTSAQAVMRKFQGQPPKDIRALLPDLPESVSATIVRLLDRDPGQRPLSAAAVAEALEPFSCSSADVAAKRRARARKDDA